MCCCMIESSVFPQKSSGILENVQKRLNCLAFGQLPENLRKFSKEFGNRRKVVKRSSLVGFYNKQNNRWLLVDIEFLFLCSTYTVLTCSLRSLVR